MALKISKIKVESMAAAINARESDGSVGGCVAIRGTGTQKPVCMEMTRAGCDQLNKELQALDDGSFALFKGEGKPC